MLIMSYIGDHVWLMTSRQTLPDLRTETVSAWPESYPPWREGVTEGQSTLRAFRKRQALRQEREYVQLIYVWVEDPVYKAYAWALVWVLVG